MKIKAESFWIQKRGNRPEDYEDAAWPTEHTDYDQHCVRIAVADGATESVFAKRWADQLVCAAGNDVIAPGRLSEGIARLRNDWQEWLAGKSVPWYVEEKARLGTFAALVVLELRKEKREEAWELSWNASAVGDSCLFHVREDEVLVRFPLDKPESFNNRPFLLGSVGSEEKSLNEEVTSGTCEQGDIFYLMTDALACWFLEYIGASPSPGSIQRAFRFGIEVAEFCAWVESLRDNASIRNDDCTLIRVQVG